MVNPTFTARL
ncbi:hypothetical protein VULLAG_LOCUS7334 [Vulpes lagopus]